MDPLQSVRKSTARVASRLAHVQINNDAIYSLASSWAADSSATFFDAWADSSGHLKELPEPGRLTAMYVFVIDTLNFCFWPCSWEYDQIATSLTNLCKQDINVFNPDRLEQVTEELLRDVWLKDSGLPLMAERARLLNELGRGLREHFDSDVTVLIQRANKSAAELVRLITAFFPGFRDHAIHGGEQVFFYKRAQILVGDLWGAFSGRSLGEFSDIAQLTMFADYRVPQLLRSVDILTYSPSLAAKVDGLQVLPHGGDEEVEIRAATVQATELLRQELETRGRKLLSVELDWLLWQTGEKLRTEIKPAHRTLSIYY